MSTLMSGENRMRFARFLQFGCRVSRFGKRGIIGALLPAPISTHHFNGLVTLR